MEHQHKISIWTAILMNINIMIGVGIFVGPPLMAQKAGFASFLGWPAVALVFLPIVLSIATMARLFPGAGSFYAYSKNIIGPVAGFISGWSFYLAYTGVAAIMAICLRDIALSYLTVSPIIFNFLFITFVTLLSFASIKVVGRIQNAGTFFKLFPLLFVLAIFLAYWNPNFRITLPALLKVPAIVPIAIFGYWGFESCCSISHLIKGDKANASRAILAAFFITMIIYMLFHLGLLHIMGNNLATQDTKDFVGFLGLTSPYFKSLLSMVISMSLIFAFANAIFSIFTMTSSTLHAMASKKVLPFSNFLTKINRQERPWVALTLQGVLVFLITVATNNKYVLISLINLGILIAFLLTLIALLKLQISQGRSKRIVVTLFAFASWIVFTYFSWFAMGDTNLMRLAGTATLVGAMLVGLCMYYYQQKKISF